MSGRAGAAGFTLLEILVALVVLGFLLLGLSEGTRFGLHAWDSETKLVNRSADMDGMDRVLRSLITQADPGDFDDQPPFHGTAHTLAFISRLPMSSGAVSREADIGLGVDAKHRLVLRWSPHPHAERLTRPVPPPQETVLLEGVDQVAFSFLRPADQNGGGWTDKWELTMLPLLVRITVSFPKDDRRHWPTIEAAPMLARAEQ
jgi:general secretion pathway protein J